MSVSDRVSWLRLDTWLHLPRRAHAALMPDYNRKATAYWCCVVLLGLAALAASVAEVAALPPSELWKLAGGLLLSSSLALFPVRVPRTNQSFSLGDVFIFLLLMMLGTGAGCIAAGLEALVSCSRRSSRWTTRLGSLTIAASTLYLCGHLLEPVTRQMAVAPVTNALPLLLSAMVFGLVYAGCSAFMMMNVARLKRSERPRLSDMVSTFGWVGAASSGAAALAALLFITERLVGLNVMLAIVPTLGLMLTTLHFFNRQQSADEAVRDAAQRALEREAELERMQALQRETLLAAQHLRELETSERRFNSAFTHASIGMALISLDGKIHMANPALGALLDRAHGELTGTAFSDCLQPADQDRLHAAMHRLSSGQAEPIEVCCRRPEGGEIWASVTFSMFSQPDDNGPVLIVQVQDVTARRIAEVALRHRAFHDKLTGLPNRECFHQALVSALARADGGPGRAFAVLFLDFDRFKLVNDSKGHTVGDEFLVAAAKRLASGLRKGDMLARLGGDEFAILAYGLHLDAEAVDLADRLQRGLSAPLRLSTMEISATASMGITFSSLGYLSPEDMLRDADIAMYRAKSEGKARYALFDAALHTDVTQRVRLEADLRVAVDTEGLSLAYQPLYDLNSRRLVGFEALARWQHPELGPLSPGCFIPVAEESGLITRLTNFVLNAACAQLTAMRQLHADAGADLHMHVNVAARDVADPDFVGRVALALQTHGLPPHCLVIELTENILMEQLSAAMSTLMALRALGVGLSVDDFGTGYSSLSHLSTLPIDSLKIDMSFVRPLQPGSKEAAVIRAIVLLGTSLGKSVIAEGIETALQLDLLRDLGCHVGQGFYMSRPLASELALRLPLQFLPLPAASPAQPAPLLSPAARQTAAAEAASA